MRFLISALFTSWLRIIQINDVYELDSFAGFKTLVKEKKQGPDKTIVICAGDFLSPSLLSSLDQGASMVDCLKAAGVTHACFGNHEADVTLDALKQRMEQSNFAWINTNMRQLDEKLGVETPEYVEIVVESNEDSTCKKVVALLGLLTNDPSLYRPGAFAGAKMEPVIDATKNVLEKISHVDLIVPLSHQSMRDDRLFCTEFGGDLFPVVCGGHDHEVYDETVNGSRIIKAGMDAQNGAVIDIQWNSNEKKPTIAIDLFPTKDFAPDADMVARVKGHQLILRELDQAQLFSIKDWVDHNDMASNVFSTHNNRLGPSTGTKALCTMIRMGMRAQCGIINAGSIRANKVYNGPDDEYFTWSDLKAEIPFPTDMTACYLPGKVLQDTIAYSRRGAQGKPPRASGGYIHCCNNIKLNKNRIESIQGKPFDPSRLYLTALPVNFFSGIDNHKPLLDWWTTQESHIDEEAAIPAKNVLVQVFASLIWLQMGSFSDIDTTKDGILCRDEVKERLVHMYGHESVADLMLNSIMSVADMNNDGTITPLEMMIVHFCATDAIDHVCTQDELKVLKDVAANVLGMHPSHDQVKDMVEQIRDSIDLAGDGLIHRDEAMKALGRLKRTDLLN